MIEEIYGNECKIGFIEVSTSLAIKNLDPIAWDISKGEYFDSLIRDGVIIEIGSKNYWKSDVINLLKRD